MHTIKEKHIIAYVYVYKGQAFLLDNPMNFSGSLSNIGWLILFYPYCIWLTFTEHEPHQDPFSFHKLSLKPVNFLL